MPSDSDSDRSNKYRKKHYRRSRSSSSDSSNSSSNHKRSSKYSKSRRRYRSRSRSRDDPRPKSSYRSSPGSSKSKDKRRYKDRRRSKSISPVRSNSRKIRSPSREKSTSRSSSVHSNIKIPLEKSVNIPIKDEFTIEPRIKESILEEINADSFVPKKFTSNAQVKEKKLIKNHVIDLTGDNVKVPIVSNPSVVSESIFHSSILMDQTVHFDKWVKKLYNLRQKAISDLLSLT
ncbi:serine/Arginine-related protein 53-like [Cotesia glomerata]|uniref:Uncharacterized protein n=1 Tax=Cotesia glomerata TaxID=32391 RepID=A0AAV7IZQ4_COTGL|nr:serine/Arginine-related protein 53-like [Cotesia glomerata]KAH0563848.1 hypothetical protein KQX54_007358 [Cotesia glomerata]